MPGVSLEGLAQAGAAELAELRQELGAFRGAVEGQLEQALQRVQPLARALQALEEEHLELRAELARLGRRLDLLVLQLGPQEPPVEDLSTLLLEAQDPCAHFEGTEEPSGPVAHPPAFSSTRQQSVLHLSRSNSGVSAGSPAPRQHPAGGVGGWHWPMGLLAAPRVSGAKAKPVAQGGTMAAVHGQCSVTGICHHLGLLLRGAGRGQMAPACSTLPACQRGGQAAGSCPAPTRAQQWCRWWYRRTWPASPPAGSFAVGRAPGRGIGTQDGARCTVGLFQPRTSAQHLPAAASLPYSGPGPLPAAHCWGVVLKRTWRPSFAPAGAELA